MPPPCKVQFAQTKTHRLCSQFQDTEHTGYDGTDMHSRLQVVRTIGANSVVKPPHTSSCRICNDGHQLLGM